jgi:iron complex transport system permease protein
MIMIIIFNIHIDPFRFDSSLTQHQIIHKLRLPRVLAGALVGVGVAI